MYMIEKEHVSISLPIGRKEEAKRLGVNMSYHATQAIEKEIKRIKELKE
jgi:post-segregation antitoxin (ccd killing protein)